MSEIPTQVLTIQAPARIIYELLTDAQHFAEWMAVEAELEPRPGGLARWRHANADVCKGWFVELVPHRRVVFTCGWERADVGIPPGSTGANRSDYRLVRYRPEADR